MVLGQSDRKSSLPHNSRQGGFVVGFILLAVVLVIGITAAFAVESHLSPAPITAEQRKLHVSTLLQQSSVIRTAIRRYNAITGTSLNMNEFAMDALHNTDLVSTSLTMPPEIFKNGQYAWRLGTLTFLTTGDQIPVIILPGVRPEIAQAINLHNEAMTVASVQDVLGELFGFRSATAQSAAGYHVIVTVTTGGTHIVTQAQIQNMLGHSVTSPELIISAANQYVRWHMGLVPTSSQIVYNGGQGVPGENTGLGTPGDDDSDASLPDNGSPGAHNGQRPNNRPGTSPNLIADYTNMSLSIANNYSQEDLFRFGQIGYIDNGTGEAYFIARIY